jgi:hypothetical protein
MACSLRPNCMTSFRQKAGSLPRQVGDPSSHPVGADSTEPLGTSSSVPPGHEIRLLSRALGRQQIPRMVRGLRGGHLRGRGRPRRQLGF